MKTRNPYCVDGSTGTAAWNAMWKSVWPRLLRQCGYWMHGDADAAGDLAVEVALCLCGRRAAGTLRCRNLAGYACTLAHLRAVGVRGTRARWAGRLAAFTAYMDAQGGRKVATDHGHMYDGDNFDFEK